MPPGLWLGFEGFWLLSTASEKLRAFANRRIFRSLLDMVVQVQEGNGSSVVKIILDISPSAWSSWA